MRGRPSVVVVGAGIAGLSLAAEIADRADVTVVERESQPGYHSSGRSAALYIEPYMNDTVFALTRASRGFFEQPPRGFAGPLVRQRGGLEVAGASDVDAIDAYLQRWQPVRPDIREVSVSVALAQVPVLRHDYVVRALFDPLVLDIDVHALLSGHRQRLREQGGLLVTGAEVTAIDRDGERLQVRAGTARSWAADVVVIAAGAWSEALAVAAGAGAIGLQPRRRTACLVDAPAAGGSAHWPCVHRAGGGLYFKPEAGRVMVSPADATPTAACDAQPEELDVAIAIERLQAMASFAVTQVRHRWAGLRSFVVDAAPVVGFDAACPKLFWLAGHGGFGVQTSPAMARLAAALLFGGDVPADLARDGIHARTVSPARLRMV